MCSDEVGQSATDEVAKLTSAIDDLAAATPGSLTAAELTGRVASVWTLIGDLDPELARRAADYGSPGPPSHGLPPVADADHGHPQAGG
jgi:hypothetical protein